MTVNRESQYQSDTKASSRQYIVAVLFLLYLIKIIQVLFSELFIRIGGNTPDYYPDSMTKVFDQLLGLMCWWALLTLFQICRKRNIFAASLQNGLLPELVFLLWLLFAAGWRGALTLALLLPTADYVIIATAIHWIQLSTLGIWGFSTLASIFMTIRSKEKREN